MSDDVTIPRETARRMAASFRNSAERVKPYQNIYGEWADLLDPPPPSLRDRVAEAICAADQEVEGGADYYVPHADAVLAVVAGWLAAQPMPYPDVVTRDQRDHDVRLLRGES